jgi:hypothetical protein
MPAVFNAVIAGNAVNAGNVSGGSFAIVAPGVPGDDGVLKIRLYGPYLRVGIGRGEQIRYDADALSSCFGHFAEITFFDSANTKNRNPNLRVEFTQSG